jgi:tetratricopeptide (TPR) repeat protein
MRAWIKFDPTRRIPIGDIPMKKQKPKPSGKSVKKPTEPQHRAVNELIEIHKLMTGGQWPDAHTRLRELSKKMPNDPIVTAMLLDTSANTGDNFSLERAAIKMYRWSPTVPECVMNLGAAYLSNTKPVLASRKFEEFLAKWPGHDAAPRVREQLDALKELLQTLGELAGPTVEEGLELTAQHEEMQSLLLRGELAEARRLGEEIVKIIPHAMPAWNNLSTAYAGEGNYPKAVEMSEHVLELQKDNIHALSNLVRYCRFSGRDDDARAYAARLRESKAMGAQRDLKAAEGLTFVQDHAGVLAMHENAVRENDATSLRSELDHYVAVAHLGLGDVDAARASWGKIDETDSAYRIASDNLKDLDLPAGQRHGVTAFSEDGWYVEAVEEALLEGDDPLAGLSPEAAERAARKIVRQHPEIVPITAVLFELGDPKSTERMLDFSVRSGIPEMLELAARFAVGQRGRDALRMRILAALRRAGSLPPGPVRFWSNGTWTDIRLFGQEIDDAHRTLDMPVAVQSLYQAATSMQNRGDLAAAATLLQSALQIAKGNVPLQHSLASLLAAQGKTTEAIAITERMLKDSPGDLLARCHLASHYARAGRTADAEALLGPAMQTERLHADEYAALCAAQIDLLIALGKHADARTWAALLAEAAPDHPAISELEDRIGPVEKRRIGAERPAKAAPSSRVQAARMNPGTRH